MYAGKDEECWFCPLTKEQPTMQKLGIDRPVAVSPQKVVEALTLVRDEHHARMKKYLEKNIPCGQNNCHCLTWLITGGSIYVTCPGKAKNITLERWTNWLAEAVPYFEKGHVISNQVLGLELQPPEGYYTDLERGKASVLEGHRWMIEHGVAPSWSPFVAYTGTKIENAPCPHTEYYLDIGIETHQMMLEHKLYTPTRFFFCYRGGIYMISADFAQLRWGELNYNEYRDSR